MAREGRRGLLGWLGDAWRGTRTTSGESVDDDWDDPDDAHVFSPPEHAPPAPQPVRPTISAALRPPGAVAAFTDACTRCGRCVEACPESAIGIGADGFPVLSPAKVPCQLCPTVPCAAACPDKAIMPLSPLDIRIGFATVSMRLCLNTTHPDSCDRCYDQCPVDGVMARGDRGVPTIDTQRCTGCGLCARSCRAEPGAILIRPRSQIP